MKTIVSKMPLSANTCRVWPDRWQHMIDGTNVRGHVSAAGGKGGAGENALGGSRGGFTSKIHARCDKDCLSASS